MPSHFKIPMLNPFKFIRESVRTKDFDGDWARNQIKAWEFPKFYQQKWQKADTTPIQIESSIAPNALLLIDALGQTIKTFNWTSIVTAVNYQVYETTFDVSDVDDGVYFLYQVVTFGAITWPAISEPINCKTTWPSTILFRYKNTFNDGDVIFLASGTTFVFRCEGAIPAQSLIPKRNASDYANQSQNVTLLKGYASRVFTLFIGGTDQDCGVAPWVIDLLNRVFDLDVVSIDGKRYAANVGVDWKTNQPNQAYPLISASLEIAESLESTSLEFQDETVLGEGLVIAYNFQTGFFGPGAQVPITEIITNE